MLRRLLLRLRHARRRHYSSSYSSPASVHLSSPTFAVYGANMGVGKTLVSAGLAASLLRTPAASPSAVLYLKPLQTNFPADSDAAFIFRRVPALLRPSHPARLVASHDTLSAAPSVELPLPSPEETTFAYDGKGEAVRKLLACRTLYAWREPVSPHLAAEREGMAVEDAQVRWRLAACLVEGEELGNGEGEVWKLVEITGSAASPGPSSTLQCDLYRGTLDLSQGNLTFLELELGCVPNRITLSRNFTVELLHGGVGGAELEKLEQSSPKQAHNAQPLLGVARIRIL